MTKTEKINKHPGWRLSRSEKNWYYLGDSARLFCTVLINTYMTTFLIFHIIFIRSELSFGIIKNRIVATGNVQKNRRYHESMITTLTDNPSERNSILTVKGVISIVAAVGYAIIVTALMSESVGIPLKTIAITSSLTISIT